MKIYLLILFVLASNLIFGQGSFDGGVGTTGCKAIHADSSVIKSWGSKCDVSRGFKDIANPNEGKVNFGQATNGIGKVDNQVVSLGDGGSAVVTFDGRLFNGPGADFVVFENSFSDDFLELAFVEVSKDGLNYWRFPSISETPNNVQMDPFGLMNPTNIYNLAGKYRASWGVPFDLEELKDSLGADADSIYFIRVVDVVGSIKPAFSRMDSRGNTINDPYPTDYEVGGFYNGGFDLDAVGLIHYDGHIFLSSSENEYQDVAFTFFPNPVKAALTVKAEGDFHFQVISGRGEIIMSRTFYQQGELNLEHIPAGVYVIAIKTNTGFETKKLIKR
ncbi:MAG: T9SS type A sorting domain-containing protein [Flavobacteriales bacterium]|nr:T9SS type A sorting domain-containing protein [Flavobacteriales bacterium]